jgi:Flp pilus assembly protein TadD
VRAQIYCLQKNFAAACTDYDSVLQLQPKSAATYNNRGIALLQLGKLADAEKDALKAIQLEPQLGPPYELMGELTLRKGKFADCIKYCNQAIERNSTLSDAFYFRGCAYERAGNKKQADLDKQKAAKMGYKGELIYTSR